MALHDATELFNMYIAQTIIMTHPLSLPNSEPDIVQIFYRQGEYK